LHPDRHTYALPSEEIALRGFAPQRYFLVLSAYSLPSEGLDIAARSAAMSNPWFLMSISLVGREYFFSGKGVSDRENSADITDCEF
jgi:hypothetical protein